MPGSVSSCSRVAVARLIFAPEALAAPPAGALATGSIPTMICSPSVRTRAMLSVDGSTLPRTPPASAIASCTREPGESVTMPGCFTLPTTSTTSSPDVVGEADAPRGPGAAASDERDTASGDDVRGRSDNSHQVSSTPAATAMVTSTRTWAPPTRRGTTPGSSGFSRGISASNEAASWANRRRAISARVSPVSAGCSGLTPRR
jgi:hypothetical protein